MIFVGFQDEDHNLWSINVYCIIKQGETWNRRKVPFEMNGANLKFHPTNPDAILVGLETILYKCSTHTNCYF